MFSSLCCNFYTSSCILINLSKVILFKQINEDQVNQMDIENSFITRWKDTQVTGK